MTVRRINLPDQVWDLIRQHAAAVGKPRDAAVRELLVEGFKAASPAHGRDLVGDSIPLLEALGLPPQKFRAPKA